jgi:hypothetical protein
MQRDQRKRRKESSSCAVWMQSGQTARTLTGREAPPRSKEKNNLGKAARNRHDRHKRSTQEGRQAEEEWREVG